MEVNVYNIKGEDTGRKITLNESIFGIEPNDHAIYLDVKQFMANQRQGTHKSKERSEISGSTRKIGRQKGGGGARRGDMTSPASWFCPHISQAALIYGKSARTENIRRTFISNAPARCCRELSVRLMLCG